MTFGIIKADTLTHSTAGSLATNFVVEGSAKAWANFQGDDATVDDSFNHSSVADTATGKATASYTSNMSNADYCMPLSFQIGQDSGAERNVIVRSTTTSGYVTVANDQNGSLTESVISQVYASTLGDLA